MNWLGEAVQKEINPDDTVLDLGCGNYTTIEGLICKSYLGLDVWLPYLDVIKETQNVIQFNLETDHLERFPDKSYDIVICLDVLEHLDLKTADNTLRHMKRITRKKAIIFTPSEFYDNNKAVENAWDLGNCPFQKHKCVVSGQTLKALGFKINNDNEDRAWFGVYYGNGV